MRQPAYAKRLWQARLMGRDPESVLIVYGDRWDTAEPTPAVLGIKPAAYAPGVYDWRAIAGLFVIVDCRIMDTQDSQLRGWIFTI